MGVKVTSDIPDVMEFAETVKNNAIARKASKWQKYTEDILRAQHGEIRKLTETIHTEITDTGFVGTSDSDIMKYVEFGMDERPAPDVGIGMETIDEIAPMRRSLYKLS